jgi:molybdenum-dependent DNA-binding transcriptional regulator ModE
MSALRNAHYFRHFLAVVNEGSLTAAAQKVAVTQSALTKSIRKLEQELGTPLFERLPRGAALTVYGKTLLPHAQRIVAECRLADLELQAFGVGHSGLLKVGEAPRHGPNPLVGRPLSEIERYYIEQTLALTEGNREEAARKLGIGERTLYRVIQDEHKSIFFSTHNTTDLERIADYITFIEDGKIVFSESKDVLLERYRIVKGSRERLSARGREMCVGIRETRTGFEALSASAEDLAVLVGEDVVVEKANLEDIMVYSVKGAGDGK